MTSPTPAPPFTYDSISAFPLAWRWTQSTHEVLTSDDLANIRPLQPDSARAASNYARALDVCSTHEQSFQLTEENEVELRRWLARLPVAPDERIVLAWNPSLAVETLWNLFLWRWSAFWYPSSDDLEVFPASGRWVLRVSHFGRFGWTSIAAP